MRLLVELLVVRHGVAEDKDAFAATGKDDSLRPLTKEGRWKLEQATKGLRRLLPSLDVIATSPFTRAVQTAAILADEYDGTTIEHLDALTPTGTERKFMTWVRAREPNQRIAAVGHDPHLTSLVSWLVTGEAVEGRIVLRKGGACLLHFDGPPRMGKATVLWAVTPAILRRLAG
jgi:phosphohistidine phosphatase